MAQEYIKIDNTVIRQPDEGLKFSFETTYSEDTQRNMSGKLLLTPMFTVEAYEYEASYPTVAEVKTLLQKIATGKSFSLRYFSPYYGAWRTDSFYVGKGSLVIGRLNEAQEEYDSISFSMIGVNPIA